MDKPIFLPSILVDRFNLTLSSNPNQFDAPEIATFYVTKLNMVCWLTNYDVRENDGGFKSNEMEANSVWCLFTFFKGKRSMIFYTLEQLNEFSRNDFQDKLELIEKAFK